MLQLNNYDAEMALHRTLLGIERLLACHILSVDARLDLRSVAAGIRYALNPSDDDDDCNCDVPFGCIHTEVR